MRALKSVVISTYDLSSVHMLLHKRLNISSNVLTHIRRYLMGAISNKTNFAPTKTYLI